MIGLTLALALAWSQAPEPLETGLMQRYGPGVMAKVVENRIGMGDIPASTDPFSAVARPDCALLGQSVWIEWPNGQWSGPHTVADCSSRNDYSRHRQKGLVIEVSYELAAVMSVPIGRWLLPMDGPLSGVSVYRSQRLSRQGQAE
jgi:hypothetical protein